MEHTAEFSALIAFLSKLPAISLPAGERSFGSGHYDDGTWWVKFQLDLEHPLAWRHVQELGHVLNLLSDEDRLPSIFKPVSPPPYLNGGIEYISWIVESTSKDFTPDLCAKWLEGRLPDPVDQVDEW